MKLRKREEYARWLEKHRLGQQELQRMREEMKGLSYRPWISVLLPVYNVEALWLRRAIESVRAQLYENWELCIVDDGSDRPHIREILDYYKRLDPRVKVKHLPHNQGIARASNEALAMAKGAFIALLDHDDELSPDALFQVVKLLNQHPEADMIYSDEDKLSLQGSRCEPFFKPDWSPDMFLSYMYTCHLGVYRADLVRQIGGFREGYEGSQDYDLVLRLSEQTDRIYHIPRILYHWRKLPGSTASLYQNKSLAEKNAQKALREALRRRGIEGEVLKGLFPGSFRIKRAILGNPLVSIIIPTRDRLTALKRCLDSIRDRTSYRNYEIILVNNGSKEADTLAYLGQLRRQENIQVLDHPIPFNYSALNNWGVGFARGDHLLFLNNDTEVINGEWLEALLEHSQRPEVGAVGAKLLFPNNTLQHAGVILGLGLIDGRPPGIAGHSHKYLRDSSHGYFGIPHIIRNYSAVTAACMMMRKEVFYEVGGFDAEHLPIAFNDVDLCLRLRERGYLIVYTPFAVLYHHESASRGYGLDPQEINYMQRRWGDRLLNDPYYNPNLTLEREDFGLRL